MVVCTPSGGVRELSFDHVWQGTRKTRGARPCCPVRHVVRPSCRWPLHVPHLSPPHVPYLSPPHVPSPLPTHRVTCATPAPAAGASQRHVYEESVRPFTADLINGRSGCVLAYGQTGAGKTYTVFGDDESTSGMPTLGEPAALPSTAGLVPRVLSEVLHAITDRRGDCSGTRTVVASAARHRSACDPIPRCGIGLQWHFRPAPLPRRAPSPHPLRTRPLRPRHAAAPTQPPS